MFRCQCCNKVTAPGEKAHKEVIESRDKTYYNEFSEVIGQGWEIVKEIVVCLSCWEQNYVKG